MSEIKQNLRKRQTIQKFGLDLDQQKSISQNKISLRTVRQVVILKQEISKLNKPLEKVIGKKNPKDDKQVVKGKNKKVIKPCLSHKFTKDEVFLSDNSFDKQEMENVQKKKIFQSEQKVNDGSQIGPLKNEEFKEQGQNLEQQNFILNLIALQARSELRFELDWKNLQCNEEMPLKDNNLFKIQHDESCDLDSVICYSFFSNDNEKLENVLIKQKNTKDNNQMMTSKIEKLEEQYQCDLKQIKIEENNQISQDYCQKSQSHQIKTLNAEDQQNSINEDDGSDEINKFYHFLNLATYENPSRASCKEIHKLIRQRHDKYCVDVFMIDVIWSEFQQLKELRILNFQQFLKCIQDMHEHDLLWLDQQGRKVYLI